MVIYRILNCCHTVSYFHPECNYNKYTFMSVAEKDVGSLKRLVERLVAVKIFVMPRRLATVRYLNDKSV